MGRVEQGELVRDQQLHRLADELLGPVAEQVRQAGVGERDPTIRAHADDRVRGLLKDAPHPQLRGEQLVLVALAVGHVVERGDHGVGRFLGRASQRDRIDVDPDDLPRRVPEPGSLAHHGLARPPRPDPRVRVEREHGAVLEDRRPTRIDGLAAGHLGRRQAEHPDGRGIRIERSAVDRVDQDALPERREDHLEARLALADGRLRGALRREVLVEGDRAPGRAVSERCREDPDRNRTQLAVPALRHDAGDGLACTDVAGDVECHRIVGGHERRRPAQHLVGAPAEQLRGREVPEGDRVVGVVGDDGQGRRVKDRLEGRSPLRQRDRGRDPVGDDRERRRVLRTERGVARHLEHAEEPLPGEQRDRDLGADTVAHARTVGTGRRVRDEDRPVGLHDPADDVGPTRVLGDRGVLTQLCAEAEAPVVAEVDRRVRIAELVPEQAHGRAQRGLGRAVLRQRVPDRLHDLQLAEGRNRVPPARVRRAGRPVDRPATLVERRLAGDADHGAEQPAGEDRPACGLHGLGGRARDGHHEQRQRGHAEPGQMGPQVPQGKDDHAGGDQADEPDRVRLGRRPVEDDRDRARDDADEADHTTQDPQSRARHHFDQPADRQQRHEDGRGEPEDLGPAAEGDPDEQRGRHRHEHQGGRDPHAPARVLGRQTAQRGVAGSGSGGRHRWGGTRMAEEVRSGPRRRRGRGHELGTGHAPGRSVGRVMRRNRVPVRVGSRSRAGGRPAPCRMAVADHPPRLRTIRSPTGAGDPRGGSSVREVVMFVGRRRGTAVLGVLVCLLAGPGAVPPGAAANPPRAGDHLPRLTAIPPRIAGHAMGTDGLPVKPDATSAPIVVTTLADIVADDGACSLREAITAAESNTAGPDTTGRCRAGSATSTDMITFATGGVITLAADLPTIAGAVVIDGATAPAPLAIDGADAVRPFDVDVTGSLDVYDLTVTRGATTGSGGAFLNRGWLSLVGVTVSASSASVAGGGISGSLDSFTWIEQSTITGNATDGFGGGIRTAGTVLVYNAVVSDNLAVAGGGGLASFGVGDPYDFAGGFVYNATFSGNLATGAGAVGGGIHNVGYAEILNATFTANSATVGGAIEDEGEAALYNVTITANAATTGSALSSTGSPYVANAIAIGNTGADPEIDAVLDVASTHNLTVLPDGVDLAGVLAAGLADNGGYSPTIALVRDAANPAWGGGDDGACSDAGITFDQRGYRRSSPCDIGAYEIDDLAPVVATPSVTVQGGQRLSGSSLTGRVAWPGTDDGSGIAGYELEVNVNGHGYVPVAISPTATAIAPRLANGSRYQYRARAVDADGNWSSWKAGAAVTVRLLQQSATGISYSTGWKKSTKAAYSGGTVKYARSKGAWVKLTTTGRVFTFITTKAPSRGKAKVYVDGKLAATIDLRAASSAYRVQAWTRSFSTSGTHTIKVVLLGTSGRPRVDADAFAVLR